MINNETGRFMGSIDTSLNMQNQLTQAVEAAADQAAAAAAYDAAMRDQAVSMRQGEQERGKAITKAFKEGDANTRAAIANQYMLSPSQIEKLKPLWEKPKVLIGAAAGVAGAGLVLYLIFRSPKKTR